MKKSMFNSRMKQRLLWLMLALLPVGAWAEDDSQAMLYVEKTDGTVVKVPIIENYPRMRLTYNYSEVVRKPFLEITCSDNANDNFRIKTSEIKRLYTGFEATGIKELRADVDVSTEKVFTLSGRLVSNDSRTLDLQPKGVYIVKKNGKYQKVVRP